ncbi:SDR family oxidoreductase [Pendulispora brunnea]|uniref:SDR family oxidoreductase n=1 Tax=Pendulispora brunnea TaxID=2905690 RepID=A0ABZ2JW07_9BACT
MSDTKEPTSKVALVTGASSGIGLGIAKALLNRGYGVVATSRHISHATALSASAKLALVDGDVGDVNTASRAVDTALSRFGKLDLLVNNAGIFIGRPFTDYTDDDYARLLSTNLAGFYHMTRAALRHMAPRASGHIVNIGASLASQPIAGIPSALPMLIKGGLEAASRSLAIEYAGRGIRVNTIAPGVIDTPMVPKDKQADFAGLSPANRLGTVDDIADAVLYLDGASFVSGEVLHLDGGAHAGKWS